MAVAHHNVLLWRGQLRRTQLQRTGGFTLIELLVVVMIMAVVMSLTGVMAGGRGGTDIETVGRILMSDLRHVRSQALLGNVDTGITVDVSANEYYSQNATIKRELPAEMSVAITVDENKLEGSRGEILFYPDGSSSGGSIKLKKNGRELDVVTTWLNGNVTLEK